MSYPNVIDRIAMRTVRVAYYEICDTLHISAHSLMDAEASATRSKIIKRLLELAAEGVSREEMRNQVLKSISVH